MKHINFINFKVEFLRAKCPDTPKLYTTSYRHRLKALLQTFTTFFFYNFYKFLLLAILAILHLCLLRYFPSTNPVDRDPQTYLDNTEYTIFP